MILPDPTRPRYRRRAFLAVLALALGLPLLASAAPGTSDSEARAAWVLLNRWFEAQGGAWRIEQLKTLDYRCQLVTAPGQPGLALHMRATLEGAYRYDYEVGNIGQYTQAFDGRTAWQKNQVLGFGRLTPEQHAQNQGGIDFRAPVKVGSTYPHLKVLPDETVGGRQLQVLELGDRRGGRVKWYFDGATGLRVRVEEVTAAGRIVVEFSDFRKASGIMEPFRTVRIEGEKKVEVVAQAVVYNDAMDPELFAAPQGLVEDNQQIERLLRLNSESTGLSAIGAVRTRVTKALMEVTTSGLKIPLTVSQKQPNLVVSQQEVPGTGTVWRGYNGRTAWAWSELEGYRTMQGAELQQLLSGADLAGPMRLSTACPLRKLLDETDDHGRRVQGIALATLQGLAGIFYFDTKTGYLVRLETDIVTGPNGQLKVTVEFSDFRKVEGCVIPFVTIMTNPAMRSVTTIESVQQNVPLDDAIFQPKKGE